MKDKILEGYFYMIDVGDLPVVQTGSDGARDFVNAFRKNGMSDEQIGNFIQVSVGGKWHKLGEIKVQTLS